MQVFWQVASSYGGTVFGPTFGLLVAVCVWAIVSSCYAFLGRRSHAAKGLFLGTGTILGLLFTISNLYVVREVELLIYAGALHYTTSEQLQETRIIFRTLIEWNGLATLAVIFGFGSFQLFRNKRLTDDPLSRKDEVHEFRS